MNEKRMGVVAIAAALALASAGFVAKAHAQDAAAAPAANTQAAGTQAASTQPSGAQPSKQASKKSKAKMATVTSDAPATGSMVNWKGDRPDLDAIYKIKDEGINHSHVMEIESYLTDVYGPRASPVRPARAEPPPGPRRP